MEEEAGFQGVGRSGMISSGEEGRTRPSVLTVVTCNEARHLRPVLRGRLDLSLQREIVVSGTRSTLGFEAIGSQEER